MKRYQKVQSELTNARQEFRDLNASVDPNSLREWTAQESYAMKMRSSDVKVMDIYDVKTNPGKLC